MYKTSVGGTFDITLDFLQIYTDCIDMNQNTGADKYFIHSNGTPAALGIILTVSR